jgi:DnaJ-class molecular chaperone
MQKVNAAKEILTDPEKRQVYDQYGLEGMKSRVGNEHFSGFPGFSGGS